jgi:tRNA dimethylallyltransferase
LIICGATATGKTDLAVECALKLGSEVISADSQLVYKDLNIGTAKPSKEEMKGVKHHMIDVASPFESFSVSDYAKKAEPIIQDLESKGKIPVICGGTGFYINSLLYDLSYGSSSADEKIREKYEKILNEKGKDYLFEILKGIDGKTAEILHPNDTKRVIRAIEIYEVSGRKKSEIVDVCLPKREYLAVAINYPRDELYRRIERRVDIMFERGLVEEVKGLMARGIDENCQCMQAIGYKEVLECLKNGDNESTMRDIIKKNTRHYAKRQLTFFKRLENIVWLDPDKASSDRVLELMNE